MNQDNALINRCTRTHFPPPSKTQVNSDVGWHHQEPKEEQRNEQADQCENDIFSYCGHLGDRALLHQRFVLSLLASVKLL